MATPKLRRFLVYSILEVTVDESAAHRPDAVPAVAAELAREQLAQNQVSLELFPLMDNGAPLVGSPLVFKGPHPTDRRVVDRIARRELLGVR